METATPPVGTPEKRPALLINRNFTLLWCGEVFSLLGDYIFDTTLILWVGLVLAKGQTWAPLAVSGVVLTTTLSMMIVGPIAGVYADRWNKRRTMLIVNIVQAALVGLLMLVTSVVPLPLAGQLAAVYVVALLVSASDQFFNQSATPLISDIVQPEQRPLAMGRVWTMVSLGTIIGPAIASPLFVFFGPQLALLFNLCTFLLSCITLFSIRAPREEEQDAVSEQKAGFFNEFAAGLHTLVSTRVLLTLLITSIILALGNSALTALNLFFVLQNLHASPGIFGLIATALGIGALAGSLLGSRVIKRLGMRRTIWCSLLISGALLLIYARLTSFLPALLLLFIMGIPGAFVNIASGALVFEATPRQFLGRTTAIRTSLVSISAVVGAALAGYLDSTILRGMQFTWFNINFGTVDTIFMVTGLLTLIGGIYAMANLPDTKAPTKSTSSTAVESGA